MNLQEGGRPLRGADPVGRLTGIPPLILRLETAQHQRPVVGQLQAASQLGQARHVSPVTQPLDRDVIGPGARVTLQNDLLGRLTGLVPRPGDDLGTSCGWTGRRKASGVEV